jgi:hypothetical protein
MAMQHSANGDAAVWFDRVWHAGEFTPTAGAMPGWVGGTAVNRPSSGQGVYMAIEIQTAFSAAAHTITLTYTNQAGVAGQTTSIAIPASALVNAFYLVPFATGDSGVRAITGISGSAAPPTGAYNVVLVSPVFFDSPQTSLRQTKLDWTHLFPMSGSISPSACIFPVLTQNAGASNATLQLELTLAHG